MTKHTPGPWTIKDTDKVISKDRFVIECATNIPKHTGTVALVGYKPNARLIAAAPDLLEACKEALIALNTYEPCMAEEYAQKARVLLRQAIVKAEGKQ